MNLDDLGGTLSVRHAAALAAQLREGSRIAERMDRRASFGATEWLLLSILNALCGIAGAKPADPFAERPAAMTVDEMAAALAAPRKAVEDGD